MKLLKKSDSLINSRGIYSWASIVLPLEVASILFSTQSAVNILDSLQEFAL